MTGIIAIINLYSPDSYFINQLSETYDKVISALGVKSSILLPDQVYSSSAAGDNKGYDVSESELRKSIEIIRQVSAIAIFTSWKPQDNFNPRYKDFISQLFNDRDTVALSGNASFANMRLRIVSVIDDEAEARKYKTNRDASMLSIQKADFMNLGFGRIFTRTFGNLRDNNITSEYGRKSIVLISDLAGKDAAFAKGEFM